MAMTCYVCGAPIVKRQEDWVLALFYTKSAKPITRPAHRACLGDDQRPV
jgi:hypothetical protein